VIAADPAILTVLFVGVLGSLVVSAGSFLAIFRRIPSGDDFRFPGYLVVVPVLWAGSVVSTYCKVVVSVMADRRLRGEEPAVADGMSVATSRLGRIAGWTALSIAVGLFLQVLAERLKLAGVIARQLLGLAWGLATTFVIPVIAFEDVGISQSLRRSAALFRSKWGETVVAQGTIGGALVLVMLPLILLVGILCAISLPVGIVVGVVVLSALVLISGALDAVVRVALYRYAIDGAVLGAFTVEDLEGAYRPKERGRWKVRAFPLAEPETSSSFARDVDLALKAPGWFDDPAGRYESRWWNGHEWTSRVRTGDIIAGDPLDADWT
jgi:hypothetical protein